MWNIKQQGTNFYQDTIGLNKQNSREIELSCIYSDAFLEFYHDIRFLSLKHSHSFVVSHITCRYR